MSLEWLALLAMYEREPNECQPPGKKESGLEKTG